MSDISLSKAVRSNLLSLQNTAEMMAKTQDRLSTGNKVNSALDNPTNFFTAQSLNSRAGDLNALMDSMANGIQTLEAADNGLTSITKTLESMQSTLRQARQDKSFQTQSFSIGSATTGELSFAGGAFGSSTPGVALANTALTATSLGLDAANATDSTGVAATASTFTGVGGAAITAATDGDIEVTVGATAYTVTLADGDTLAQVADKINDAVGSDVAAIGGGELVLTNSDGTGITVADASATGTTAQAFGTPATVAGVPATSGANAVTWGGAAIEINDNARIAFTATINGTAQSIEITREDVIKAGNEDGTIDDASEFAAILGDKIDGVTAAASGNTVTLTSEGTGTTSTVALGVATITGTTYTADELVKTIDSDADLKTKIRASNDDSKLRIENLSTQELTLTGVTAAGVLNGSTSTAEITGNSVRADLAEQFNELRDQLDKLSDDASFNGINLLRGDLLKITFNETGTSSIGIQTKDEGPLNAATLNVFDIEAVDLDADDDIDTQLANLKSALNNVRSQSSTFGSNLSIVQNRQDFTKQMINTLETGGANLTLADMNEEAANLLALQTRQSLSSSSLSLASQADQSVLQLLQ